MTEFSLTTARGSMEIRLAQGSHKCVAKACAVQGGGLGQFTVHSIDREDPQDIYICGNCLAASLAIAVASSPELRADLLKRIEEGTA